ncbi:Glycine cleavage system transcriptional activator GcvA [hydrothermal vent metagenome]|uniref:Glycine cleavage system transcriptional activator GcvA n=1 Tax=hydrothermal vent metagenome TaxID=652676 RepID=A0A3B0UQG1_9ZZZZ
MRKYNNIPPLRALKAFESSARYLSFTKAADELFVTQAAISHQIKSLEDRIGVKLFKRFNRSLQLTTEGEIYLLTILQSLEQLEKASRQLANRNAKGMLNISLLPSFATKWMAKRIWKFQEKFPDIEVSISAFEWLADFKKENIDIAIRYGKGDWPDAYCELLFEERVFPICNRREYKKLTPNPSPTILLEHRLHHDDFSTEDWDMWFKKAGIVVDKPIKGTRFSHTVMMLESIENSKGFALGRTPLVIDDLKHKLLYAPFNISIPSENAYYFVCQKGTEELPKILEFKKWIMQEADASKQLAESLLAKNINS